MTLPVVALVGRPNVGKSALFNRIARKQISLVYDRPGVTRDRIQIECQWEGKHFELIDTGGIGLDDESGFEAAIEREVQIAVASANPILLVVDGRAGLNALDIEIAQRLRKSKSTVILVVNKIDGLKQDHLDAEFSRLGLFPIFPVSAAHGGGMDDLMTYVANHLPTAPAKEQAKTQDQALRVAIVGRPNAGKSSLVNSLLDEDRLIVSPIAGTTRDAVDIHFEHQKQKYCLMDTAGMRKRAKIHDPLEQAMTSRTAHTINRAHICTLVIDAVEGVGEQEKKIAGLIQQAARPCIILVNKWDVISKVKEKSENFREDYEEELRRQLFFLDYAPVAMVSALEKKHLHRWLKLLHVVAQARNTKMSTGVLNRVIKRAMEKQLPSRKGGKGFKILYATQVPEGSDVPTITAFVNNPKWLMPSYQRYLEQQLRKEYPCEGCPIRWEFRARQGKKSS